MHRREDSQGLNFGDSCIYRGGERIREDGEGTHRKSHRKPGMCGDMKAERT